ncbi:MAG TPA: hypothetical protein DDW50_13895, partial [Firmicutes bacterium]|nr:hypothetical protein [Bacillota bacterium]
MGLIQGFTRAIITLLDGLLLQIWLFRLAIGYKMWGNDFRIRQLRKAPARYLITALQRLGADIDGGVTFKNGLSLDNIDLGLERLHIGNKAYIGPGVFMDLA